MERTIAITRPPADASEFISLAESHGITPVALPTIELVGRGDGIASEFLESARGADPDYAVFMSSKAASLLLEAAGRAGIYDDVRMAIANTEVVSVGPKTSEMLKSHGIRTNHQPGTHSSVGVGEEMTRIRAAGKSAIIPRSAASGPFLRQLLEKIGVRVVEVPLYDVRASGGPEWGPFIPMLAAGRVGAVIFTSASSVRAYVEIMGRMAPGADPVPDGTAAVSIGPFTAAELGRAGIPHTVSEVHTIAGAFEAARRLGI